MSITGRHATGVAAGLESLRGVTPGGSAPLPSAQALGTQCMLSGPWKTAELHTLLRTTTRPYPTGEGAALIRR